MAISAAEELQPGKGDGELVTGLRVYRASRLEALIGPLWELVHASWPGNVLAPQTIVAAHPGMKQWLSGELARHNGSTGISANLDIVLPSVWLERLAQSRLGERAVSLPRYQTAHLRWTLHEMLAPGRPVTGVGDPRVDAYLSADDHDGPGRAGELARRRFQLADRLARIYSQYLVYRPDWLRAWEGGQFAFATGAQAAAGLSGLEANLLGPLWREIWTRLGRHRGHAMQDLRTNLEAATTPLTTLHIFGVSHLAPSELDVFRAYAKSGLVALYVPDPCREYWGGLVKRPQDADLFSQQWRAYRQDEQGRISAAGEGDYWQDQGHPLLARWGRMGQHFFSSLADGEIREDIRHWQDTQPQAPGNRLQRLQESIRQLDPELMRVDGSKPGNAESEISDASLRIHACHTRQRELEVLRDALIDAVATGIAPGEMVVMAPDIQAYLPLIPAVFVVAGTGREPLLPYHLADAQVSRSHSLFNTVLHLLETSSQRITAPEVVDLLSVPEIQRRLDLDPKSVDSLTVWLQQSRVAWALDGAHRASFGVPAIAEHSFSWAMDRMVAGYLMSDAPEADRERAFNLPDGTELVPVTGIHGPSAEALGGLDRLLQEIQAWCDLAGSERTAREWASLLDVRLEALFRIDRMDRAAREAWDALKRFVRSVETEPAGARENPLLHFAVVRDLLTDRLAAVPEQQRLLMGGVTFCGMVPQRAIPFRLVAVLGLNDGDFPRASSDGGLDLMTCIRRLGDRDVRSDDRYLFLETIMAARDRLHLGFIGEGVKDGKPRNPAAPLAELMAELDAASGLPHDAKPEQRPWLVEHPLQPFDGRYFDGKDKRLFSYSKRYEAMQGSGREPPKPFLQESSGDPDPLPDTLALSQVVRYYKDPAAEILEKRLKLKLDALDANRLPEDEPLDGTLDRLSTVARKVFFQDVLPKWGEWNPEEVPAWVRLTGLLPPGRHGAEAWEKESQAINAAMATAHASAWLNETVATHARQEAVDVEIADFRGDTPRHFRITGRIQNVFPLPAGNGRGMQLVRAFPTISGDGGRLKSEGDLHFGERVSIFMDWALLRLQAARSGAPLEAVRLTLLAKGNESPWQSGLMQWDQALLQADAEMQKQMLDDVQSRVAQLVHWWHEAQRRPHWYFAKTSWASINAKGIQGAWSGFKNSGERTYSPGYNRMIAGDVEFDIGSPELEQLVGFAKVLHETISLQVEART